MIVTPCAHGLEDIIGQNEPGYIRTPGLHMSTIYNDYYQYQDPKRYDKTKPMDVLRLEAGLSWERLLEEAIKDRIGAMGCGRPGELIGPEGIIYSPDLIIFNGSIRLGEIKLTWMSSREVPREKDYGFPPKFEKYLTQMKCYCYCLETPYARLIAFFVNGDYRPPTPELLAWDITFSPRELKEEWATMMNWARHRKML